MSPFAAVLDASAMEGLGLALPLMPSAQTAASGKDLPADGGTGLPGAAETEADLAALEIVSGSMAGLVALPPVQLPAMPAEMQGSAEADLGSGGKPKTPATLPTAAVAPSVGTGNLVGTAGQEGSEPSALARVKEGTTGSVTSPAKAATNSPVPTSAGASLPVTEIASSEAAGPTADILRARMPEARTTEAGQTAAADEQIAKTERPTEVSSDLKRVTAREERAHFDMAMLSRSATPSSEVQPRGTSIAPAPTIGGASGPSVAASATGQSPTAALDLETVIDRLVEARQNAGAGRIHLSMAHDDFGAIGVRLDQAVGAGLVGVALSSADPGLAPAVQAALAERAQSERQPPSGEQSQRQDSSVPRGEGNAQNNQPQPGQSQGSGDQARSSSGRGATSTSSAQDGLAEDQTSTDPARANARGRYA
jgi:hypothetical protein